jgi:hypothetical protein
MLTPEQLRQLHPRKRLAAIVPHTPKDLASQAAGMETSMGGAKVGGRLNRTCNITCHWYLKLAVLTSYLNAS